MTIDRRVYDLRAKLHACPELSGREVNTLNLLENFLREHTALTVERRPEGLLATHWEGERLETLGFRADVDAIPAENHARHGCGHDGHSAILCALALAVEGRKLGKNLRFILQPAEETGEGAKAICNAWPEIGMLHRVYGLHNIPGHPLGTVLARPGCFACASRGVVVDVQGKPAHAAYPNEGLNPAGLLCETVLALPGMIDGILNGDPRLLMHTVVGMRVGGENFGMSASDGRLCLTLRGHREADIDALTDAIRARIKKGGMTAAYESRDVFPDTTNPPEITEEAVSRWSAAGLPVRMLDEPMRWSEDFGWYLKRVPGQFFGVGIGENHPGLHTSDYIFDDRAIAPALAAMIALL